MPNYPVGSLNVALRELRRPFTAPALGFKVQHSYPKDAPRAGLIVTYMDARTVAARLNMVCGGKWSTDFERAGGDTNIAVCRLTVFGVTRTDVGKGSGLEKEKAAFSDALKRAAVQFGVGAYLYTLRAVHLDATEKGVMVEDRPTLKIKTSGNRKTVELTAGVDAWLRARYTRWLESEQASQWGKPLDHGDEPEAVGDPVERPVPDVQENLELEAKRSAARELYATVPAKHRPRLTPAKFKAKLEAADEAQVDALIAELEAMK